MSNAFFKALFSVDDSVRDFKPWLLSVCRNEYYSWCRKKKRRLEAEPSEETDTSEDDVLEKIIRDEEYRALYRAIGLLSDERKEVITLFYFSSLSVRAIAKVTEKSEGYVKVLLHRARSDLKKILEVTE